MTKKITIRRIKITSMMRRRKTENITAKKIKRIKQKDLGVIMIM